MDDPGQEFTPRGGETYAEGRRKRLLRGRLVGYSLCIALWLLSAVPLARLSSDEGGGTGVAAAYLGAGFGIAVVIRGIYALLRKHRFWSPWLFVIAAVLAIMSYLVVSAGEQVASPRVEGGVMGGATKQDE